jgi:hypothetical protein
MVFYESVIFPITLPKGRAVQIQLNMTLKPPEKIILDYCDQFLKIDNSLRQKGGVISEYEFYLSSLAGLLAALDVLSDNNPGPDLHTTELDTINSILQFFISARGEYFTKMSVAQLGKYTAEAKAQIAAAPGYIIPEAQLVQIQKKLNELRDLISKCEEISADQKRRLLARLEATQRELHKKVSDFDRAIGVMFEIGLSLKKFGENVKPIIDRAKEILQMVFAIKAAANGSPGQLPFDMGKELQFQAPKPSEEKAAD